MGCFNVTCGVSRISINYKDKAVLIPLVKSKFGNFSWPTIVTNQGAQSLFQPFTLPVFGIYNDYGSLEKIRKDANTKSIEKYYNCNIEEFVNYICKNNRKESFIKKMPHEIFGMFVNKDIYDFLSHDLTTPWGSKSTAYSDSLLYPYIWNKLGFVEGDIVKKHERYKRQFKHSLIPNLIIWTDGEWCEFELNGKIYQHIFYLKGFKEFLKQNNLPILAGIDEFKKLSVFDVYYEKDIEQWIKRYSFWKEIQKNKDEINSLKRAIFAMTKYTTVFNLRREYGDIDDEDVFMSIYGHLGRDAEFKKSFLDYKNFESALYHVNAFLMPSWSVLQHGNNHATQKLARFVDDIITKKIKLTD